MTKPHCNTRYSGVVREFSYLTNVVICALVILADIQLFVAGMSQETDGQVDATLNRKKRGIEVLRTPYRQEEGNYTMCLKSIISPQEAFNTTMFCLHNNLKFTQGQDGSLYAAYCHEMQQVLKCWKRFMSPSAYNEILKAAKICMKSIQGPQQFLEDLYKCTRELSPKAVEWTPQRLVAWNPSQKTPISYQELIVVLLMPAKANDLTRCRKRYMTPTNFLNMPTFLNFNCGSLSRQECPDGFTEHEMKNLRAITLTCASKVSKSKAAKQIG